MESVWKAIHDLQSLWHTTQQQVSRMKAAVDDIKGKPARLVANNRSSVIAIIVAIVALFALTTSKYIIINQNLLALVTSLAGMAIGSAIGWLMGNGLVKHTLAGLIVVITGALIALFNQWTLIQEAMNRAGVAVGAGSFLYELLVTPITTDPNAQGAIQYGILAWLILGIASFWYHKS